MEAKHSFVSQLNPLPEFFGKTSIRNQSAQEQVMSCDDVSAEEIHSHFLCIYAHMPCIVITLNVSITIYYE